ncbi:retrovirus-related pol polyprotein from transposon TNT 1-94 [Tanacetum coccineum]
MLNHVNNWEKANKEQNNESITAELERYKERVKTFEQRLNIDLSSREKMIDSQMDDMIREKLALKEQIDSLEQNLSKQIKEKEPVLQTLAVFKNESKEKENKYMESEIDLEKKIKELDNIICKVGQPAHKVHMLTKPQAFYDNTHKQALGYQNPLYLKKDQRIKPTLYDGVVISNTHVAMPVIDDEETLILEEESRLKMFEKAKDPETVKQNISHKPIDYEKLNRLTEDFGKCFTPQQELSAEQAFGYVSLVNTSLKRLKFHLTQFDLVVKKRTTPSAFEEARLQDKDTTTIKSLEKNTKEKNVHREKCDLEPINEEIDNSVATLISENEQLWNEINHVKQVFIDQFDSIKQTCVRHKEQCDSLINKLNLKSVENEDLKAQIQDKELLLYVQDTCPNTITPSSKKIDVTPMNNVKKVRFAEPITSSSKTQQVESSKTSNSNTPVLSSTRVKCSTSNCGSKPPGNKKNDKISQKPSMNKKNNVEAQPRKINNLNRVAKPVCDVDVKHSLSNANSEILCASCNKSMFDAVHDKCLLDFVVQIVLWYLDSGCSKHMTGNRSQLMNFVSKFLGTVRFGNDQIARIMGYGDYQLGNVVISRVYYVEGLGHNLFSVGQFCDADLEVAFRKNTCFICNLKGVDLLLGSRDTNLCIISLDDMLRSSPIYLLSKESKTKSWLWHRRLSHPNFACSLGKSKKSSHQPKAKVINQEKLYLLHMDLCGPMHVASINGKRYILTLREWYENVGITHQTSVARTPQQNGVVERQNQTLVEAARTMLIFSRASLFLWAEAINTACYTQNLSLIRHRYNKTPYELMQDKKPNISFFHVFGSLCYPTNDQDDLGKFDAKADIGIFVAYAPAKKAFRIYNRMTQIITETIHVTFDDLTSRAFEQFSSGPGLQYMTPATSSTGLVSNPVSQQPCIPLIRDDWDRLFQPMFDEYFNPPPIAISPDAPSTSIPSSQEQEHSPIISQGFKESLKTPTFHDDPLNESPNEDSTSHGSSSNVRQIHTLLEHIGRY